MHSFHFTASRNHLHQEKSVHFFFQFSQGKSVAPNIETVGLQEKSDIFLGLHFLPFLSTSKEVKRLLYSYEHTAKGPLSTGSSKDRCKLVGSRWVHVQPNLCPMYRTQVSIPMDLTMEPETIINLA